VKARLLLLGAGSGAINNLARSLRAGDRGLRLVGCHHDRFVLRKSTAARNHLVPPVDAPDFAEGLRQVVEAEGIDLVMPGSDAETRALGAVRDALPCRTFLPRKPVLELCQDKAALAAFLRARGVPAPVTHSVAAVGDLEALWERLGAPARAWCRLRTGSGARGAVPVRRPAQARAWIEYWEEMRGVPPGSFTLSEYLPGRDFAAQALWKAGRLVLVKVCQRLSYVGGANQPSGISSTPALARTVAEPRVVDVCTRAVRALDESASGVFSIDLKETAEGVPCVTEINAGRFCMITNLFDLTGRHNMAVTYVRLALGRPARVRKPAAAAEDYYLVRDLDTEPGIYHADDLFASVHEAG
jgi:carbamoyl-phosphate synthase large subunit